MKLSVLWALYAVEMGRVKTAIHAIRLPRFDISLAYKDFSGQLQKHTKNFFTVGDGKLCFKTYSSLRRCDGIIRGFDLSPRLGGHSGQSTTTVLLSFTFILSTLTVTITPPPERCKVSQQVWNRVPAVPDKMYFGAF